MNFQSTTVSLDKVAREMKKSCAWILEELRVSSKNIKIKKKWQHSN